MKWLLILLGFKRSIERKKLKVELLRKKAFDAQRNGNLRLSGKYHLEAEALEDQILEEAANEKHV